MHDLGMKCVTKHYKQFTKNLIIISVALSNLSIIIANSTNISIFLFKKLGASITIWKLFLSVTYLIVINLTAEIEKLKFVSFPSTVVIGIVVIALTMDNLEIVFTNQQHEDITHHYWDISYTTVYIGVILYAYEAVPTFFTIRNTMEDPTQLKKVTI